MDKAFILVQFETKIISFYTNSCNTNNKHERDNKTEGNIIKLFETLSRTN